MRVALDAGDAARERLTQALGGHAAIVPRDEADLVVRDVAGAREALAAIADGFAVPTVLLVDDPHADVALAALRAGAAAVLARQLDAPELIAALDAVRAGLIVLDAAVRDALAPAPTAVRATVLAEPLTERERQVLAMLADGLSNRRIAARLAISENTVKAHVAAILAKLGATTRTEAVTLGVRLGLVML
ncbi:MAG: response regulator transcription factor [Candidatus Eremiobacteraeota bacterium]|nr:response regulator transcription factor [Candidatus Eremiobacteraeota bacterium]